MSEPEEMIPHTVTRKAVRFRLLQQLPLLVTLVVLWMLLWGTPSTRQSRKRRKRASGFELHLVSIHLCTFMLSPA